MRPDAVRKAAVANRVAQELRKRDPLKYAKLASEGARKVMRWIAAGIDTYWHCGNGGGKTHALAHLFVAMCRGLRRIDARLMTRPGTEPNPADLEPQWIELPGLHPGEAWRHWVLVNSYDQAKDSSVRAYLKLIGRHPHRIGYLDGKTNGRVKRIWIKPDNWHSDDPATWSEITFISQENMTDEDVKYVQGARVHSVHGDEMPKENVWREIRARRDANMELYLGIGATPEFKREWEWCLEDYLGCYDNPVRGRARLQTSMRDNRALSYEDVRKREESYVGDDLAEARINGEHCDISGMCPFPREAMDRMLAQCVPGRMEKIVIRGEPKNPWEDDYRDFLPAFVWVERWLEPQKGHAYYMMADTSRGIDSPNHDPCELEVWDWTEPALVCRFGMRKGKGGYLDEDSLAILADILGRQYNRAYIDGEVAGNFGAQFFLTLRKLRYPNLAHNDRTLRPGHVEKEYGYKATPQANGEIVNALIKALNNDAFLCWSRDVVSQWKDVREASDGRTPEVKRGVRHHREAMICAGRALHVILSRPAPRIIQKRSEMGLEAALRRDFGRPIRVRKGTPGRRGELFRQDLE